MTGYIQGNDIQLYSVIWRISWWRAYQPEHDGTLKYGCPACRRTSRSEVARIEATAPPHHRDRADLNTTFGSDEPKHAIKCLGFKGIIVEVTVYSVVAFATLCNGARRPPGCSPASNLLEPRLLPYAASAYGTHGSLSQMGPSKSLSSSGRLLLSLRLPLHKRAQAKVQNFGQGLVCRLLIHGPSSRM